MAEGGQREIQGLVEQGLASGVVQVVVAADDVGHAHVVVVDHHGEVVGGRAVRAQQHQVVEFLVVEADRTLDQVVDQGLALQGPAEADHERLVPALGRIAVTPDRADRPALGAGLLALDLQLLHGHEAAVGAAFVVHLLHRLAVAVDARELEHRLGVGRQSEPAQTIENRLHRFGRGALAVGVLDAQQEGPAGVARIKEVEQCGAGAPNVQGACGRGGEPGDDGRALGH